MTDHDFRQLPPTTEPPHPHKQGDTHNGATHFWCNHCAAHLQVKVPGSCFGGGPGGPIGPYAVPSGSGGGIDAVSFPTCEEATATRQKQNEDDAKRVARAEKAERVRVAAIEAFFLRHPPGWYWIRVLSTEWGTTPQIALLSTNGWELMGMGDDYDEIGFEEVRVLEGPLTPPEGQDDDEER